MASKYLQKYPVPQNFQEILHDFGREILRAQPEDIIQFAVDYFEFKVQNPDQDFPHNLENLKYNIARKENPNEYKKIPYDQLQGNIQKNDQYSEEQQEQQPEQQQQQRPQSNTSNQQRPQSHNSQQDPHVDTSKISGGSQTTHPEEKHITKEFMGELYSSAVQQTVDPQEQQQQHTSHSGLNDETSHLEEKNEARTYTKEIYNEAINQVNDSQQQLEAQKEEGEEFQYEGPKEEYEKAALLIQKNYRGKKAAQDENN